MAQGKILIAHAVFSLFCEQPVFLGIFVKFLKILREFLQFDKPSALKKVIKEGKMTKMTPSG